MTKKEMYNFIKTAMADNDEVVAFCDNELALLARKAASAKKAPKKPDAYIETVFGVLTAEPQTIDAIANAAEISNAKCTPRLNKLVADGKVVKGTVKVGKSSKVTYALA